MSLKKRKRNISLTVEQDLDDFMEKLCHKVLEIDDKVLHFKKSKNDVYNRALEFAIEHLNDWYK